MANLLFAFRDVLDELQALEKLAQRLLARESRGSLGVLRTALEAIRDVPSSAQQQWTIPESDPVRTAVSKGEYEIGERRGSHEVVAELSATWQITRIAPEGSKKQPSKVFAVSGNASTKVRFLNASTGAMLAMWRFELGAGDSPGCYFHAQILGDAVEPPFPKSLPVPRLPSIFFTPAACLEFALGELFQDRWLQQLQRNEGDLARWRRVQLERFERLFTWQSDAVKKPGSPWMALKIAKPNFDLLSS